MKIYTASKVKHAHIWLKYKEFGYNIISTWIYEAGEGQTSDLVDLWKRCITEASNCDVLVCYVETNDLLKGALVEIGAALGNNKKVAIVGCISDSWVKHPNVMFFDSLESFFNWTNLMEIRNNE